MPDLLRRFIGCVARLVPRWARREFRAEWEAEIATEWTRSARAGGWRARVRVVRRAAGAIPDAWYLFRQRWGADVLLQDVRYTWRLLRARPGFALVVTLTLALGIGANTAMFSVIDHVLLRPLPYRDPSRLVTIWENNRLNQKPRSPVAPANFNDWRQQSQAFEQIAAWTGQTLTIAAAGERVTIPGSVVTTNFFDMLGVQPAIGEGFTADQGTDGHQRVLVLAYAAWQRYFAGDPAIVGRGIDVGAGEPYQVIGVMPRGFGFPSDHTAFWRPAVLTPAVLATRAVHFLTVLGRLRLGRSLAGAQADMDRIAARQQRLYPGTNDQRGVTLVPLHDQITGGVRRPLWILGAAVVMVLLVACANVAHLMLASASGRRRELSVRAALGADRGRLARQLLVEGIVLAAAGGFAGLLLAIWATRALAVVAAPYVPLVTHVRVDGGVLAFAASVALASGIGFAVAPALAWSRPDLREGLQEGGRGGSGPGARRLRSILVAGEIAVACVLVVAATLLLRSFSRLMQVSPGFTIEHVLTTEVDLPGTRYPDAARVTAFFGTLLERLQQIPGVRAVGLTSRLPMDGSGSTTWLRIENRPEPPGEPPAVNYRTASPDYFRTLETPLLAGRAFDASDTPVSRRVVIVNEALVERFFRDSSPLGVRIHIGPNPKAPWRTIVGVVGDMHQNGLEAPPVAELYVPVSQDAWNDLSVAVRTDGDPLAMAGSVRGVLRSMDPELPATDVSTIEQIVRAHVEPRRLAVLFLGGFAGVALGLALMGVYGVTAYLVSQQTHEIGIRLALGARGGDIVRMVLRHGLGLAAAGLAAGLAAALALTRLLGSFLFEVTPTDPTSFVLTCAGMIAVGVLACYVPARRAARVDPLDAIRIE